MHWEAIVGGLLAGLIIFWLYRGVKANPATLSKVNVVKSLGTMAWLALILLAFIVFCLLLLRQ